MSDLFVETKPIRNARKDALVKCLRTHRDRPVAAVELGKACQVLGQSRETKRRRVRELVAELRKPDGYRICAGYDRGSGTLGYWLARNAKEWADYLTAQASRTCFGFVRLRQIREAVTDRISGQGRLFETKAAPTW